MRPILLALLVTVIAAAPAQAAKRKFCDIRPGATLVADGSHRVYETIIPVKGDPDANVTRIFSCRAGTRKPSTRLERFNNNLDAILTPRRALLAGRWLLLTINETTGVTDGDSVRVYDVRTGKEAKGSVYVDGADGFKDVALTDDGAFAIEFPDGSLVGYDNAGPHDLAPAATALGAGGAFVYWLNPDRTAGSFELAGPPTKFFDLE